MKTETIINEINKENHEVGIKLVNALQATRFAPLKEFLKDIEGSEVKKQYKGLYSKKVMDDIYEKVQFRYENDKVLIKHFVINTNTKRYMTNKILGVEGNEGVFAVTENGEKKEYKFNYKNNKITKFVEVKNNIEK